jgi:phosphoribosylaminoimidazole synthetase
VRHVIEKNQIDLAQKPPFKSDYATLGDLLLVPTTIYVKPLLPLIHEGSIKALAHITGGGLVENIPRVLPKYYAVELDMYQWEIPPIFDWLARIGAIHFDEMSRTFNLGIGMIAIVSPENAQHIQQQLQQSNQKSFVIGTVIALPEDNRQVVLRNTHYN